MFYAALLRHGWTLKKQVGAHRKIQRAGWSSFAFCFHDSEEVGPARDFGNVASRVESSLI
jgi:predicted RNA binding protein YcfA (HicA-like mRNA interferase family)